MRGIKLSSLFTAVLLIIICLTCVSAQGSDDMVNALLENMTMEEKVGQLFLARCPESGAVDAVRNFHLAGFVLFGRDFDNQTRESVTAQIRQYQEASPIPLLIAVDEEGGTVTRVSGRPAFRAEKFASPRKLYGQGGMEAVLNAEAEKAALLRSLGINVNLAPVCDISRNPGAFMYDRSLGESPEITGQFVASSLRIMEEHGMSGVMKHFPGYGNNADTHTGIAWDSRSLQELETNDLQPFFAGIEAGGGAIMVSHNIITAVDAEYPAGLSPILHRYIRLAMSFDGVILTDDLSMEAITNRYGAGEAAVLAVLAGNDLLCSTDFEVQYQAVLEACRSGRISSEQLDNACLHVLKWKQNMKLFPAG